MDEQMLIDGARVDGGDRIAVRNPARPDEIVGTIPRGTTAHVARAVAAAKQAQPAWAAKTFTERGAILQTALSRLSEGVSDRARLFVRENGKTLAEANHELSGILRRQPLTLAHAAALDEKRLVPAPRGSSEVLQHPYGVVLSIVPWNAPVSLGFTQIVSALLAGNCVVLKPPETCPLTLIQSAALFALGLPPGALNIVTGMPEEIGDTLTGHPDIGKIAFTGSIAAARHILASAATTIKPATLELGGNDAALILEDADLGAAAMTAMCDAAFQMSGQVCMAIKRFYVPKSRRDEFLAALAAAMDRIVVGDGLQAAVTMGPLHTAVALRRARDLLADAEQRGGQVTALGQVHDADTFARGHFLRPTLVTGIAEDAPLMREEQFAPIAPVAVYDDLDAAIANVNHSIYGLGGSVWGRDPSRAMAVARRLQTGQVWINAHGARAVNHQAPYGGVKQSGIGRKSGIEGVLEYLQSQTITTVEA